jgi:predicted RNase H-like HicB family nuclease
MNLTFQTEREDDGRWLAEVPELSGVMAYGSTRDEALARAETLALRVIAERIEHGEAKPMQLSVFIAAE